MPYFQASLDLHRQTGGKWSIASRVPLETTNDLSLAYTRESQEFLKLPLKTSKSPMP